MDNSDWDFAAFDDVSSVEGWQVIHSDSQSICHCLQTCPELHVHGSVPRFRLQIFCQHPAQFSRPAFAEGITGPALKWFATTGPILRVI